MRWVVPLTLACAVVAAAPASALGDGRLVAFGDSIAAPSDGFVERYAAARGIGDVRKITSGSTTASTLTGVLPQVLGWIDEPSDTRAAIAEVGGYDYLDRVCPNGWNRPDCPFADNLTSILRQLRAALDRDPGDEPLLMFAYYNPASGRGTDLERAFDVGMLGRDLRLDETAGGEDWGSADIVRFVSCRTGAVMVDAYPAFKAGGPALMADELHPTAAGQAVLADLFLEPSRGSPTEPCPSTPPFPTLLPAGTDGRMTGWVEPRLEPGRWWFEYGPTTAYGTVTTPVDLAALATPQAVSAQLPSGTWHVRLVAENAAGRRASADQLVTAARPRVRVWPAGRQSVRTLRSVRGAALRVRSSAATVAVVARLVQSGPDPVLAERVHSVPAGVTSTLRVRLDARGRRLVRRTAHPRVVVTVVARDAARSSAPAVVVLR